MTRSDSGSSRWIGWLQIAGILAVVAVAAILTILLSGGAEEEQRGSRPPQAVPVEITRPAEQAHQIEVNTTGTVNATAFVTLTPQVGGRVIELAEAVRAGGHFEAGEVLFRIDPRDYQVAVQRGEAAVADARSALAQLEAEAEIAREEWRATFPGREITPLAAREPQLEAARARLMSAEADLRQARINLDRTTVSLPFAGRVVESRIEAGQVLIAGQPYGEAYALDALEIVAPVPPEDLERLEGAQGRPVRLAFEDRAGPVAGRVVREGARLDARSRLVTLYIAAQDAAALRPGLFADITIEGPRIARTLALPEAAVAGLDEVHVVRGGTIESLRVDIVDRAGGEIHVVPFDYGEGVIVTPLPEGAIGREAEILGADGPG